MLETSKWGIFLKLKTGLISWLSKNKLDGIKRIQGKTKLPMKNLDKQKADKIIIWSNKCLVPTNKYLLLIQKHIS